MIKGKNTFKQLQLAKAKEDKWVFKRDLKTDKDGAALRCAGRLFHDLEPITEKAPSPLRFNRVEGP